MTAGKINEIENNGKKRSMKPKTGFLKPKIDKFFNQAQ